MRRWKSSNFYFFQSTPIVFLMLVIFYSLKAFQQYRFHPLFSPPWYDVNSHKRGLQCQLFITCTPITSLIMARSRYKVKHHLNIAGCIGKYRRTQLENSIRLEELEEKIDSIDHKLTILARRSANISFSLDEDSEHPTHMLGDSVK